MKHDRYDQNGFGHLLVIVGLVVCAVVMLVGYRVYTTTRKSDNSTAAPAASSTATQAKTTGQSKESPALPPDAPAAPTTPQTVSPPKSTTPAPAPAAAPVFTTPIQIKGTDACQTDTLAALKLLSTSAPTHYATVTKYIGIIECVTQGSGIYAYEVPPRYVVGDATRTAGTVWYAGTIAHDAGHSKLYHDYLASHPKQEVPDDVWTGQSAEATCLQAQYDALSKIGASQYQLDYVQNILSSQYYNIPYDQRWW